MNNEYAKDIIKIELTNYIILNKKIPKVIDLRTGRVFLNKSEYITSFGSYYNLLCNVIEQNCNNENIHSICNKWIENRNDILNGINELMQILGRLPRQEEYIKYASKTKHYQKYNWYFDDFNTAIIIITGNTKTIRTKFNEDEL